MSDRYTTYPDDEPIIGATYPAQDWEDPSGPEIGADEWDEYADYDDEYEGEYNEYYEQTPARQPLFYVFIGLAAILGAALIFLLFTLVSRNDGDGGDQGAGPISTNPKIEFAINVDEPADNDRIEIRKDRDVLVTATATEDLKQFELLLNGRLIDRRTAGTPAGERIYRATLKLRLDTVGEFEIVVRAISVSDASAESAKVHIVGVEAISGTPSNVRGKILTQATLRSGPADTFEAAGTVREGQEVNILGRTRDSEWLFIEVGAGGWLRRTAIDLFDAVSIVPVRDGSPTPRPTVSTQVPATPSPTTGPSSTPKPANQPDFVPVNAVLFDGGSGLRVTVANIGTSGYNGPVEVSVGGLSAGTLTRAFAVNIPAGGSASVDFDLDPPVTQQRTAQIRVDPSNAIPEANEDNNSAGITVTPPIEPPDITISSAGEGPGGITVLVRNGGGPLQTSAVTVRVRLGNQTTDQTQTLALANGQQATFTVARPAGSGQADVEVLVGTAVVASTKITIS